MHAAHATAAAHGPRTRPLPTRPLQARTNAHLHLEPLQGGYGGAQGSGDAAASTMARIVGGDGLCHCIRVKELMQDVAVLKAQKAPGNTDPFQAGGDPWRPSVPSASVPGNKAKPGGYSWDTPGGGG